MLLDIYNSRGIGNNWYLFVIFVFKGNRSNCQNGWAWYMS